MELLFLRKKVDSNDYTTKICVYSLTSYDDCSILYRVFGLVFIADLQPESYADYMITHHALLKAMDKPSHVLITDEEFKQVEN